MPPSSSKQLRVDDMMIKKEWKNKTIPKKEIKKKIKHQTVLNMYLKKKEKKT